MSKLVKNVQDKLTAAIASAFEKAIAEGALPEAEIPSFNIEVPADRANGDFSTIAAMAGARVFRRAPRQIADAVCANLDLEGTYVAKCEVAGAGFINFYLSDDYYAAILRDVRACGEDYGRSGYGEGKTVNVTDAEGNEVAIDCDTIIMAVGSKKNEFDVEGVTVPVYYAGDCAGERTADIASAIRGGYNAANEI